MVAARTKRFVKAAIAKSPYRGLYALPTMAPGAPTAIQRIDRLRARRSRPRDLEQLEHAYPPGEIEHHTACPLCGGKAVRMRHRARWYRAGQCASCGLMLRVPAVRPERVGDLYRTGNYSSFLDGDYSRNRQALYRERLDACSPTFDDGTGRTLLDYGCGTGLFMEVAAERGFEVFGVDLAPDSVERARERFGADRVAAHPAELGSGAPRAFDVITMWSVLAHIADPRAQLRELHDRISSGGHLLIYTVNADALQRRAFGGRWNGFTKNHLIFWDASNLRRLLLEIGFAEVQLHPVYGIPRDTPMFDRRLVERHYRAVDRGDGANMLHAVAARP